MLFGNVKGNVGSVDVMTPGPLGKVPLVLLATVQLVIDASRYMIWKDVTADAKDPEQKPKQGMFQDRVNTPCKLLKQSKFCKKSPVAFPAGALMEIDVETVVNGPVAYKLTAATLHDRVTKLLSNSKLAICCVAVEVGEVDE